MPTRVIEVTVPTGSYKRYHGHHVFIDIQEHFSKQMSATIWSRVKKFNIETYGCGDGRDISIEMLNQSIDRYRIRSESYFAAEQRVLKLQPISVRELDELEEGEIIFPDGSSEKWRNGNLVRLQFNGEGPISISGVNSRDHELMYGRSHFRRSGWERALSDYAEPGDAASPDLSRFVKFI